MEDYATAGHKNKYLITSYIHLDRHNLQICQCSLDINTIPKAELPGSTKYELSTQLIEISQSNNR